MTINYFLWWFYVQHFGQINYNHVYRFFSCIIFIIFQQTIVRTKDNVVKKQALTYEEIEAEREEVSWSNLWILQILVIHSA